MPIQLEGGACCCSLAVPVRGFEAAGGNGVTCVYSTAQACDVFRRRARAALGARGVPSTALRGTWAGHRAGMHVVSQHPPGAVGSVV